MASQEEVNRSKELRQNLEEILFLQRSFTDESRKAAKLFFDSAAQGTNTARAFRDISNATRDINSELIDILTGEKSLEETSKTLLKQKKAEKALTQELNQFLYANNMADMEAADIISGKYDLMDELQRLMIGMNEEERKAYLEKNSAMIELLTLYQSQADSIKEQRSDLEEITKFQEKLKGIYGGIETLGGGFEDVLRKLGGGKFADALGIGDALKETRKFSADLITSGKSTGGIGDKLKVAGKFVGQLGKNLLKALGPIALIVELVKGIMQADKETTELKKSMALTTMESMKFRSNLALAAAETGDVNITTSKLLESFSSLNKQFGFITNFATETLATMTTLTQVVGTSAESAGNLAAASSLTGKSFEENYKDVLGTSYELQRQNGVQIDLRDILEQTGKVTGQVRANLGSNPALIAKAITQAKMFGAELDDIVGASKALLDFESSIESELQAELLVGRNLNLERARAAALAGDQVTLAQELREQAGSFEEFSSMNVIQQEALAKSIGMQADQLADILMKQEIQGKTAKELRALGKEELADRLESQTLADKFNNTVDKLKGIFADVGTAFMPVLQLLGAALSLVGAIVGLFGDLYKIFADGDFSFSGFTGGLKGAGEALGLMDDGIIPAGYGDTIVRKGEGTIALNNNDTVVAGTNLGQSSQDTKRTNMLLEKLITQNDKKPQLSPVGLYEVQ